MVSRRGRMLWALAGALVLVGCTPADGEETPPPTSESPPESTEPTSEDGASDGEGPSEDPSQPPQVEAPERPAEMDEETVDGAIAAAKYFMELYPYIYATGDLTEWNALSEEECRFCSTAREGVASLHSSGGFSSGGAVDIYASTGGGPYDDERADGIYIIELGIRFAESVDHHGDGGVDNYPAEDHSSFRLALIWREGQWLVLDAWRHEES